MTQKAFKVSMGLLMTLSASLSTALVFILEMGA